ncbi:Protein kinase domain-containing protein ppk32 [Blastocladiella emersonii ATCC 22665]|nr:Protein kinase domain-containing protein ppk32 [Blastocladiella emersonii ATCC 22665]
MGNNITREYDVDSKRIVATGGPGYCWRVYNATKKTTGRAVSVFLIEKRHLWDGNLRSKLGSEKPDALIALLRHDVTVLCRLRHPCLLEVVEPLSESATTLAFVTEPLMGNLGNVLGNYTNFDNALDKSVERYELDELEIQKGVLQLTKGLRFCHDDAKLVHANLVPESIYVNAKGDWKLAGFQYSLWKQYSSTHTAEFPEHNMPSNVLSLPNLDFSSPEYVLMHSLLPESDVFALGCLIYALYHQGKSPIASNSNLLTYKAALNHLPSFSTGRASVECIVGDLLRRDPSTRPKLADLAQHPVFQTPLLAAVRFIEDLPTHSDIEKAQFFKKLAATLAQFPPRIVQRKLLPALLGELKTPSLVPFALPCVTAAAATTPPREFVQTILPAIRPLFTVTAPPLIPLALLQHVATLFDHLAPSGAFGREVGPLFATALQMADHPNVQAAALAQLALVVPTGGTAASGANTSTRSSAAPMPVLRHFESGQIRSAILPRIASFLGPPAGAAPGVPPANPHLIGPALKALHAALPAMDRDLVMNSLLPTLRVAAAQLPSTPEGSEHVRRLTAIYRDLTTPGEAGSVTLPHDVVATAIVPALLRLAFAPSICRVADFAGVLAEVRGMLAAVEAAQVGRLKQVEAMARSTSDVLGPSAAGAASGGSIAGVPPLGSVASRPSTGGDQPFAPGPNGFAAAPRPSSTPGSSQPFAPGPNGFMPPPIRPTPLAGVASATTAAAASNLAEQNLAQLQLNSNGAAPAAVVSSPAARAPNPFVARPTGPPLASLGGTGPAAAPLSLGGRDTSNRSSGAGGWGDAFAGFATGGGGGPRAASTGASGWQPIAASSPSSAASLASLGRSSGGAATTTAGNGGSRGVSQADLLRMFDPM